MKNLLNIFDKMLVSAENSRKIVNKHNNDVDSILNEINQYISKKSHNCEIFLKLSEIESLKRFLDNYNLVINLDNEEIVHTTKEEKYDDSGNFLISNDNQFAFDIYFGIKDERYNFMNDQEYREYILNLDYIPDKKIGFRKFILLTLPEILNSLHSSGYNLVGNEDEAMITW